jgi:hypothetical protein
MGAKAALGQMAATAATVVVARAVSRSACSGPETPHPCSIKQQPTRSLLVLKVRLVRALA